MKQLVYLFLLAWLALSGSLIAQSIQINHNNVAEGYYSYIVAGPDVVGGPEGVLWFTEYTLGDLSVIDGVNLSGQEYEVFVPNSDQAPVLGVITTGADGNIWFAQAGQNIAFVDRLCIQNTCQFFGEITSYPLSAGYITGMTSGPDGNLWATNTKTSEVELICVAVSETCRSVGTIVAYVVDPAPYNISAGPDGQLWFTQNNQISSMDTSGVVTGTYPVNELPFWGITTGPDGALWFGEPASIGRLCVEQSKYFNCPYKGSYKSYPLNKSISVIYGITPGADGAIWFMASAINGDLIIGNILLNGTPTYYNLGSLGQIAGTGITSGPDGNIWFNLGEGVGEFPALARRNGLDMSAKAPVPLDETLTEYMEAGVQYAVVEGNQIGLNESNLLLQKFQQFSGDNGFKFGTAAYCFLYLFEGNPYGPGATQVQNCLASIQNELDSNSLAFVALDVECWHPPDGNAPCYGSDYEPLSMRVSDITNAINALSAAPGVKRELIYTDGSNWSFLTGDMLNTLAAGYDLWNAAHGAFVGYADSAGDFLCVNQQHKAVSLTPTLHGGTGIPALMPFPGFGPWTVEHGTQYDIGAQEEGLGGACLFGTEVDFDVFDSSLFQ